MKIDMHPYLQGKFRPPLKVAATMLAMLVLLLGLGAWQVYRLEWKTGLLDRLHAQMQTPPVPMPEKIGDPDGWEYRRVTLAGSFLHDREFLVKPRTLDGASGYHMLVPFQRASGGVVMVNRGWISDTLLPKASRPKGMIQIEGIVQLPHRTSFTPNNAPEKNDWYWADIKAMAKAAKLKNVAPVIVNIAARQTGVYPAGGKVEANLSNNHGQYAIFWFTMALALLGVFFFRYWQPAPASRTGEC